MRKSLQLLIIVFPLLFVGCSKPSSERIVASNPPTGKETFKPVYNTDDLLHSDDYLDGVPVGKVTYMQEASGIDIAPLNPGAVWSHNDAGSGTDIFLINTQNGEEISRFSVNNASNIDWEDITVFKNGNNSSIFLADFGDNFKVRPSYSLYIFNEPVYDSTGKLSTDISLVNRLNFIYSDGPQNAEALLMDPQTGDIIIATKEINRSVIYSLPADQLNCNTMVELEKLGELPIGNVTGGDISDDGKRITLRNYLGLFLWERTGGEGLNEVFETTPVKLPYNHVEAQGEAFCWSNNGYYTLSEAVGNIEPELIFYAKK